MRMSSTDPTETKFVYQSSVISFFIWLECSLNNKVVVLKVRDPLTVLKAADQVPQQPELWSMNSNPFYERKFEHRCTTWEPNSVMPQISIPTGKSLGKRCIISSLPSSEHRNKWDPIRSINCWKDSIWKRRLKFRSMNSSVVYSRGKKSYPDGFRDNRQHPKII